MPYRSDSSASDYSADRDRDRVRLRERRPRAWSSTSDSSYTRGPSISYHMRRPFRDDYTDRGRDLLEHRRTRLRGPGYNPHGGAYDWSASNSSDEFYRPTRIPYNSFRHWDHQQRYDDWSGNSSDRSDYRRCHLTQGGYEDETEDEDQLDHRGHPIDRDERFRRVVMSGREDDRRRRQESRHHYRDRRGHDGDDEDDQSDPAETPHQRRENLRNSEWAQDFRSMGPLFTWLAFDDGLDERRREYATRERARNRSVSEDSRERRRRRLY